MYIYKYTRYGTFGTSNDILKLLACVGFIIIGAVTSLQTTPGPLGFIHDEFV